MTTPDITETSPSWPSNIAAITLLVNDLLVTKDFYTAVFGLPIIYEDEHSAVFQFKNTMINLLKESEGIELLEPESVAKADAGARIVFTINVSDVDATCADLAKRGVTLLNGPMDRPWGIRTASFKDPGGHVWEVASE